MSMQEAEPRLTIVNPDTLSDTFISGPMSMVSAGGLAVLTLTQLRFEDTPGQPRKAVAVARLILTMGMLAELHAMLQTHLIKGIPTAGNA